MERLLIKIGSDLAGKNAVWKVGELVKYLKGKNVHVTLISSGAKKLDKELYAKIYENTKVSKGAQRARGQVELMHLYKNIFKDHELNIGMILINKKDLEDSENLTRIKQVVDELYEQNTIPIINENSMLTNDETTFGDNDLLAGNLAKKMDYTKIVFISSVNGLYKNYGMPNQELIKKIRYEDALKYVVEKKSENGKGGMKSKLTACNLSGKECIITDVNSALSVIKGTNKKYTLITP
ncbi:Glutamate 5-kinase [Candidatus Tiddalikarchaeum anstoanum]|nr:Glutamate 5-kinase [Candidatus Tiddalikarchaeum anstoanum]